MTQGNLRLISSVFTATFRVTPIFKGSWGIRGVRKVLTAHLKGIMDKTYMNSYFRVESVAEVPRRRRAWRGAQRGLPASGLERLLRPPAVGV